MTSIRKDFSIETGTVTTDESGEATITLTCFGPEDAPTIVPTSYNPGGNANCIISNIQYNGTAWTAKAKSSAPFINVNYQAFTAGAGSPFAVLSTDFVLQIETTISDQTFEFPAGVSLLEDGTMDVYWGDGESDIGAAITFGSKPSHTYVSPGVYEIVIRNWSGSFIGFSFAFFGEPLPGLSLIHI